MNRNWKITPAGVLEIESFSFNRPCATYSTTSYRNSTIAEVALNDVRVRLSHNRYGGYWILNATGEGFAGAKSKRINSTKTGSEKIAMLWKSAIEAGKVVIT